MKELSLLCTENRLLWIIENPNTTLFGVSFNSFCNESHQSSRKSCPSSTTIASNRSSGSRPMASSRICGAVSLQNELASV